MEKLKLKRLEVKNLQGMKIGELVMSAPVVEVSSNGQNAQGKSSLLTGLDLILFGKAALGVQPIREGAKNAEVTGEFEGLTVKATVTPSGVRYEMIDDKGLCRTNRELVDRLAKGTTVDPVKFCNMSDKEQFQVLLSTLGIQDKLDEIGGRHKAEYENRTYRNRVAKEAQARLNGMTRPDPNIPKEPVLSSDFLDKIEAETAKADAVKDADNQHKQLLKSRNDAQSAYEEAERNIQLWVAESKRRDEKRAALEVQMNDAFELTQTLPKPADVTNLKAQLAAVEDTNVKVSQNNYLRNTLAKAETDAKTAQAEADACTNRIEAIQAEQRALLKGAAFPVSGLGVDLQNNVVTLNGLPFSQASQAESMIAAAMIQITAHPAVPLAVFRNAALIGKDLRDAICRAAMEHGWQIIFESLDKSELPGIVIEAGEVVEVIVQ